MTRKVSQSNLYPEIGVPFFWPFGIADSMTKKALKLESDNMKYLNEVCKIDKVKPKPKWATNNKILYSLHTFTLRDFSTKKSTTDVPVLILPPYAGHTSVIADFQKRQSLVEALLQGGIKRVVLTDWHSATMEMKDYDIDNYLEELHVAVTDLGGRVSLIGLCQGGWMAAFYAARYPDRVSSLVLAGAPIDTRVGKGAIKDYVNSLPYSFYEGIVATGGGLLQGEYMLEGFKNMHPQKQFFDKYVDLYEHIDDAKYIKRTEKFESWYENTLNLPGKWYLQAVRELFKANRFVKGTFVGLGQKLDPKQITCPLYLLAGDQDDITPHEQVFNAEKYFGTPKRQVVMDLAKGGHIGLFMGSKALTTNWPKIITWLKKIDS